MLYARKLALSFTIITFVLFAGTTAQAEEKAKSHFPPLSLDSDMVQKVASMAREVALPNAKHKDGSLMGEESAAEKRLPIISKKLEAQIVNHAVFWTTVHWCKLNMYNMGPTLHNLTAGQEWSEKQTIFIPVLHGTTHALVREQLLDLGTCTDEFRDYIVQKHAKDLAQ